MLPLKTFIAVNKRFKTADSQEICGTSTKMPHKNTKNCSKIVGAN